MLLRSIIDVVALPTKLYGQYNPKYACWSTMVEIWTKIASYCESCEGWSEGDHHSKAKNGHFFSDLLGLMTELILNQNMLN